MTRREPSIWSDFDVQSPAPWHAVLEAPVKPGARYDGAMACANANRRPRGRLSTALGRA
jgi:hypothetical protein